MSARQLTAEQEIQRLHDDALLKKVLSLQIHEREQREEFEIFVARIHNMEEIARIEWWLKYREEINTASRHKLKRLQILLWLFLLLLESDDCQTFFTRSEWHGRGCNSDVLNPLRLAAGKDKFGEAATMSVGLWHGHDNTPRNSPEEKRAKANFFDPDASRQQYQRDEFGQWQMFPIAKIHELYDPSQGVDWERTKVDEDYYESVKRQTQNSETSNTKPKFN